MELTPLIIAIDSSFFNNFNYINYLYTSKYYTYKKEKR